MQLVLQHNEVLSSYSAASWQYIAAKDTVSHVTVNAGRLFPCVFAIRAVTEGGFHYCFAEDAAGSNMAAGLTEFLRSAHEIGPYASLSYIFPPEDIQSIEAYNERFWNALKRLHALDTAPWPDSIPFSLRDPNWTFCFDGEPVFPLCLTPAHINRQTRFAKNFSISFQPRWVFKHHLPDKESMEKYSVIIRKRISAFDRTEISPYLGLYGGGHLDAEKYFFHDQNQPLAVPESLR
jgi:uncharacterized protein